MKTREMHLCRMCGWIGTWDEAVHIREITVGDEENADIHIYCPNCNENSWDKNRDEISYSSTHKK